MIGHNGSIMCATYSPDGKELVTGSDDRTLRRWDLKTGKQIGFASYINGKPVVGVEFSPDGKEMLTCDAGKQIIRWDVEGKYKNIEHQIANPKDKNKDKIKYRVFDL